MLPLGSYFFLLMLFFCLSFRLLLLLFPFLLRFSFGRAAIV